MVSIQIFDLQKVGQGHELYNIAEYVVGWLFSGLEDGEKMADLSQSFSTGPPMRDTHTHTHTHTNTHTHTHTHTPMIAIEENAMHCILPKMTMSHIIKKKYIVSLDHSKSYKIK